MTVPRQPKRPISAMAGVLAAVSLVLGVWVSTAVADAGLLATIVTLIIGAAYGLLLFSRPPRNRLIGLGFLALVPVVLIVIVAIQDFVGSVQYAWIFGFIFGGIAGGYAWPWSRSASEQKTHPSTNSPLKPRKASRDS